ncbi:MAG: sigma-70 family RNA polymerase sigma factor [Clostridium sp.]|nr:sigma-70 family RNA polymerase sigma factor [Clostridium sp.]
MKITELNLAEQLKKKNTKALDFLIDNYSNLIYKVIYNVLNNYSQNGAIEECLNDVFLSIWNHSNMFTGKPEKFVHWICAIGKYKAIDYQRKFLKNKESINIDDYNISSNLTTEDKILANESAEEILQYISEFSEMNRNIFIMRYYLGKSVDEIAMKLGVTRNVVDTRICRCKKLLKLKLENVNKEENCNGRYIQIP